MKTTRRTDATKVTFANFIVPIMALTSHPPKIFGELFSPLLVLKFLCILSAIQQKRVNTFNFKELWKWVRASPRETATFRSGQGVPEYKTDGELEAVSPSIVSKALRGRLPDTLIA